MLEGKGKGRKARGDGEEHSSKRDDNSNIFESHNLDRREKKKENTLLDEMRQEAIDGFGLPWF